MSCLPRTLDYGIICLTNRILWSLRNGKICHLRLLLLKNSLKPPLHKCEAVARLLRFLVLCAFMLSISQIVQGKFTGLNNKTVMLAFAEYERGMIVERTQTGKAVARQDPNFKDGRPKKFTAEQIALALSLLE